MNDAGTLHPRAVRHHSDFDAQDSWAHGLQTGHDLRQNVAMPEEQKSVANGHRWRHHHCNIGSTHRSRKGEAHSDLVGHVGRMISIKSMVKPFSVPITFSSTAVGILVNRGMIGGEELTSLI